MSIAPQAGMLSLLPAAVTIVVATAWRRVSVAMACGVLTAALVIGGLHPGATARSFGNLLWSAVTDLERLKIVAFVLLVGGLIEIVATSGAYVAFAESIGRHVTSARRTRLAIWGLSCLLFFDDYANVLISGSSMRTVAQKRGVRPAMVAYIVDVVAVLASVMLVSTWAAFEQSTIVDASRAVGVHRSAADLFLASLPYHFYTFLAVFLAFVVALTGRWFGARWDNRPVHVNSNFQEHTNARPGHVVAPFATLVAVAIAGIAITGIWRVIHTGERLSLFGVLSAAAAIDSLVLASVVSVVLALVLFKRDGVLRTRHAGVAWARGVRDMLEIGVIILLAKSLSEGTIDLGAGAYLGTAFAHVLSPTMVPVAMFTLAMLVTVATGFSWGSMAIVMPIAYSFTANASSSLPIFSAAVITGAVAGEHLIPYSEKAVLSAVACGIPAVYHFKTHVLQSITAFAAACIGFILVGRALPLWICYGACFAFIVIMQAAFARESTLEASAATAVSRVPGAET